MMDHEILIRLSVFLGLFAVFAVYERITPKVPFHRPVKAHWITHFSITMINTMFLRLRSLTLPFLAVGAAIDAAGLGWGLFNVLGGPPWIEVLLFLLILNFILWAQHLITHKVPLLWRLHRVQHADIDFGVSTAIRFHPVEIALSMMLKIGVVYLLGPIAWVVILFEIVLNGNALFGHANILIPAKIKRALRWFIVTPDMHRIHHSVQREEHNRNYAFALSVWDRLFRTYQGEMAKQIVTGLQWRDERPTEFGWSLWLPFMRK